MKCERECERQKRMRMQREWMRLEGEQDIISDQCKALMSRITVAFHLQHCLKAGESVRLPTVSFWQGLRYHRTSPRLETLSAQKHTHIATFMSEKTHTGYQKYIDLIMPWGRETTCSLQPQTSDACFCPELSVCSYLHNHDQFWYVDAFIWINLDAFI